MSEPVDWKAWALAAIAELDERAADLGADYLPVECPRCARLRLMVGGPVCEKCSWRPEDST